jgi:hypothetical protein
MAPISAAVPRNQKRSTSASANAGRWVVKRSVALCPAKDPDLIDRALTVRAGDPADRAAGPSWVMRRARSSMGIAARMISAEMMMIA